MFLWLKINLFILNILIIVSSLNETNPKVGCTDNKDPSFIQYRDVSNISWTANFYPTNSIIPMKCYLCSFEFTMDSIRLYNENGNINITFKRINQKQFNYMVRLNVTELSSFLITSNHPYFDEIIDVEMKIHYSDFEKVFIFYGCFSGGEPIISFYESWFIFEHGFNNTEFIQKYREDYKTIDWMYRTIWSDETVLMKPCGYIYYKPIGIVSEPIDLDNAIVPEPYGFLFYLVIAVATLFSFRTKIFNQ